VILSDITTPDWEPDDLQSFVHLLASADLFEVEALISTSGWSIPPKPLEPFNFVDVIDRYRTDLPNLMKRSGQEGHQDDESVQSIGYWPTPEYFEGIIRHGFPERGMGSVGDGKATNGSDFIIDIVDENDARPVYVCVWGGANVLAQSIWDVRRTRTPAELDSFLSKIRVYAITDQDRDQGAVYDNSSQFWMRKTFPELFYISSESAWVTYGSTIRDEYWESHYVTEIQGKGALGDIYPKWRYIAEGDSPSFLYVWPGLNDPEDPRQASFGGKFVREITPDNVTVSWTDTSEEVAQRSDDVVTRTLPDQINDFIARMDWAAKGEGNRNPHAMLEGDANFSPILIAGEAGLPISLSAEGSEDPDGDALSYEWYHDEGAGGYFGKLCIAGRKKSTAIVTLPEAAKGLAVHVVLRVVDDGQPALASYRRAIIQVR
jgi:hypothetical protein